MFFGRVSSFSIVVVIIDETAAPLVIIIAVLPLDEIETGSDADPELKLYPVQREYLAESS